LENKSSFPPNPLLPDGLLVFVDVLFAVVGAEFQPPKSSSPAMMVSAGFVLLALEAQPLSRDATLDAMEDFTVVGARGAAVASGAPHISEEPHGSIAVIEAATGLTGAAGAGGVADKLKGEEMGGAVVVFDGMVGEVNAEGGGGLLEIG
jgi:hypothetical protein